MAQISSYLHSYRTFTIPQLGHTYNVFAINGMAIFRKLNILHFFLILFIYNTIKPSNVTVIILEVNSLYNSKCPSARLSVFKKQYAGLSQLMKFWWRFSLLISIKYLNYRDRWSVRHIFVKGFVIILIFVFSKLGNVYKYVVRIISISFPWSKLPWALVAIVICFADM